MVSMLLSPPLSLLMTVMLELRASADAGGTGGGSDVCLGCTCRLWVAKCFLCGVIVLLFVCRIIFYV